METPNQPGQCEILLTRTYRSVVFDTVRCEPCGEPARARSEPPAGGDLPAKGGLMLGIAPAKHFRVHTAVGESWGRLAAT